MKYLIFFFFLDAMGSTVITCTHPQVCNLFENSVLPLKLNMDPHHFEPSLGEVKALLSAEVVAFSPRGLNPWEEKIRLAREEKKQKNILLEIPDNFKQKYESRSAINHFWLYPEILCYLKEKYGKRPCPGGLVKEKLEQFHNLVQGKRFFLTHDSMKPLFVKSKAEVLFLRTSLHDCEVQPESLKYLEIWKKDGRPIVWILEENAPTFEGIKEKIGKKDSVIKTDLLGKPSEDSFAVYDRLISKLKILK
jgi:hypothetical protein